MVGGRDGCFNLIVDCSLMVGSSGKDGVTCSGLCGY